MLGFEMTASGAVLPVALTVDVAAVVLPWHDIGEPAMPSLSYQWQVPEIANISSPDFPPPPSK